VESFIPREPKRAIAEEESCLGQTIARSFGLGFAESIRNPRKARRRCISEADGNLFGDCGTTKLRLGKGLRFEVIVKRGVIRHGGINLDDYMQS